MTRSRAERCAVVAIAATTLTLTGTVATAAGATTSASPTEGPSPTVEFTPPSIAPSPAPSPAGPDAGVEGSPAWWDVAGRVREALNGWLHDLVSSAVEPALALLGDTVLATPQVAGPGRVAQLWTLSTGLANAGFVLFVLVGGVIVMGHETVQTRYTGKEIAPRLVLGLVAANTSLFLAGQAITISNALTAGLLGSDPGVGDVGVRLGQLLAAQLASGGTALLLVGLVAAVLAVVVVAVYVIRVAVVVVLVAGAPVALACHALPHTDPLARLWWRALTACLAVPVGQALVVAAAVRVALHPEAVDVFGLTSSALVDLLVIVCLLWLLLAIPRWAVRAVLSGRGSTVVRTVKYYVVARAARAVLTR